MSKMKKIHTMVLSKDQMKQKKRSANLKNYKTETGFYKDKAQLQ